MVEAYKSLLAQKESLESSLDALGESASSSETARPINEQLDVLRETLATVNKEKARRETAFTDDKKRLLDDVKVARIELKALKLELAEQRCAHTKNVSIWFAFGESLRTLVTAICSSPKRNRCYAPSRPSTTLRRTN